MGFLPTDYRLLCRPFGAWSSGAYYPRLAPWAAHSIAASRLRSKRLRELSRWASATAPGIIKGYPPT